MGFIPAHIAVGARDATNVALVLHGILGSAQNMQGFARKLHAKRPDWCFLLVDLRGHGGSRTAPAPHTIAACADDLARLVDDWGTAPRAVVGHSFGGKVCLQYAQKQQGVEQVWLLDANPTYVRLDENSEVTKVLNAARSVASPIQKRAEVVAAMRAHGLPERIATWMTTNLRLVGEHYQWTLDFEAVEALLADYCKLDFWPFLAAPKSTPHIHWVIGEHTDRIAAELRARGENLPGEAHVSTHLLPAAAHWVHVDNPGGLVQLMAMHWLP